MKLTKEQLKQIIKEELEAAIEEGDKKFRHSPSEGNMVSAGPMLGDFKYILLMKPDGERLSDLRYYKIEKEADPRRPGGTVYFVNRDGKKIYLPQLNGRLMEPSATSPGEVIGSLIWPSEKGEGKIPLGRASASVGKVIKNTPPPEQMGKQ